MKEYTHYNRIKATSKRAQNDARISSAESELARPKVKSVLAEKNKTGTWLLGNGDMFYVNGSNPVRVQCAFIDTPETERICEFISQQGNISPFELPDPYFDENEYNEPRDIDMQNLNPLFEDVARLIVMNQEGLTRLTQRKFAIGYNRASRLMDQLEKAGVVGEAHGSRPREVFIQDEVSLENLYNALRWLVWK